MHPVRDGRTIAMPVACAVPFSVECKLSSDVWKALCKSCVGKCDAKGVDKCLTVVGHQHSPELHLFDSKQTASMFEHGDEGNAEVHL